jgi:hypothetical protein
MSFLDRVCGVAFNDVTCLKPRPRDLISVSKSVANLVADSLLIAFVTTRWSAYLVGTAAEPIALLRED